MAGRMPDSRYEMKRARYEFRGNSKCKSCDAPIEWWKTINGKMLPINAPVVPGDENEPTTPHWATCPTAKEHRDPKSEAEPKTPAAAKKPAGELTERATLEVLERELAWFGRRHQCRAVVAVRDDGNAFTVCGGQDGDQLRSDLITIANAAKRHLEGMKA